MKTLTQALTSALLFSASNFALASSLEDQVIDLDCPSNVRGTIHMNNSWQDGYFTVRGFGTLALRSFEQQDRERAVLTFSNGDVRAKIRTWVKDNAIRFYLWDQGDWRSCDWQQQQQDANSASILGVEFTSDITCCNSYSQMAW